MPATEVACHEELWWAHIRWMMVSSRTAISLMLDLIQGARKLGRCWLIFVAGTILRIRVWIRFRIWKYRNLERQREKAKMVRWLLYCMTANNNVPIVRSSDFMLTSERRIVLFVTFVLFAPDLCGMIPCNLIIRIQPDGSPKWTKVKDASGLMKEKWRWLVIVVFVGCRWLL